MFLVSVFVCQRCFSMYINMKCQRHSTWGYAYVCMCTLHTIHAKMRIIYKVSSWIVYEVYKYLKLKLQFLVEMGLVHNS